MSTGGDVQVSPHNPNIIFAAGGFYFDAKYNLAVSRTTDGGTTWARDTIITGTYGWSIVFDPVDSMRVYIAGDSNYSHPALYMTSNLGQAWTSSRTGLAGKIWKLAVAPSNPQVLYAASGSGMYRSTDAGASWTATGFTTQSRAVAVDPDDAQKVYVGTYGSGVHVTTDGGTSWTPMNDGLTNLRVLSLGLRPGAEPVLLAGTEGGSVFRTDLYTGVSGPVGPGPVRPAFRVTPSPARGGARLEFALDAPAAARAALYDHSGRMVADLGQRNLAAGKGSWAFSTRGIPAGTYFVRLVTGDRTRTARVTILD